MVEGRGLGYGDLCATNPGLVYARCRPSWNATGTMDDYALLVEARSGFCTQLAGHRPGPIFLDYPATGGGTAFLLTTSVLALLGQRAATGRGGWSETSLYDGMLTTLGCMMGRSERAPEPVESYWEHGSTFPNFLYRCADDELIQVWFGGKGMYAALIDVLGDEPSQDGYYADQTNGLLNARAVRWQETFATRPRDGWIPQLREAGVACEPVLAPGEVLADPHLGRHRPGRRPHGGDPPRLGGRLPHLRGSTVRHARRPPRSPARGQGPRCPARRPAAGRRAGAGLLGLRGRTAGRPGAGRSGRRRHQGGAARGRGHAGRGLRRRRLPAGQAQPGHGHQRARAPARWSSGSSSGPTWCSTTSGSGVSERLGIDEATVAQLNPRAVYCHASAFGPTGPRARFPGNDALMQALTGLERAVGGQGNDPTSPTWIPIDMSGGWVAAAGILAGLYARATSGQGQRVATSLLGAGMLLQSGVVPARRRVRPGARPWTATRPATAPAIASTKRATATGWRWSSPTRTPGPPSAPCPEAADLPATYAPLRGGRDDAAARTAETVLESAFATEPAAAWVSRLRRLGALAEVIAPTSRDGFRQGILDDPVNRQLGRVASYQTPEWGHFEQIGRLERCGPGAGAGPPTSSSPGIGEHSVGVLTELGFEGDEIDALLGAGIVRQR